MKITTVYKVLEYISGLQFWRVPKEVSNARRSNSNKMQRQLADVYKLKGNRFYAEMIQDLERH